jgi:uncharacterized membrane protein
MEFLIERLKGWDAHHRLLVALLGAAAVAVFGGGFWPLPVTVVMTWDLFSLVLLALAWVRIAAGTPTHYSGGERMQDFGNRLIFMGVLTAACMSLFAVGYLLGTGKPEEKEVLAGHAVLSIITVIVSWSLIHTLFTLHYAYLFHGDHSDGKGGIDFPGEEEPDYLDFAYFSFVIGMTCQVSDVDITGKAIRRLALLHGLVSFAFNAAILALAINIVSTMVAG